MKRKAIILIIVLLIGFISPIFAASPDYDNITVLKDWGTSTPIGDENPRILDDSIRAIGRLLGSQYHEIILTANGTATTADTFIIGSSSSGILISFPLASACANGTATKTFVVKNRGAGTMTLSPSIDGVGSPTVSQNQCMSFFTDGTSWFEISANKAFSLAGFIGIGTQTQGTLSLGTQTSGTLSLGTQTSGQLNFGAQTGTISLGTQTNSILSLGTQTTGTIGLGTQTSGTISLGTQTYGSISLGTQTSGTIGLGTQTTGNISLGTQTNGQLNFTNQTGTFLKMWKVGSIDGTGTVEFVAGDGTSIVGVDNNGSGSITVTAVGTASAGGWVDTGTQTQSTVGYPVVPRGTLTVSAEYGVSGLLDRDIPPDITLTNITQITNRLFSSMQGNVSIGTQTNYADFATSTGPTANKWITSNGSGTINAGWFPSGMVIGGAYGSTSAVISSLGYIPFNSAPTLTDGTQILTLSYAASGTNTVLRIRAKLNVSIGANGTYTACALFAGSNTTVLESDWECVGLNGNNGRDTKLHLNTSYLPGTTTPIIYNINAGGGNAGTKRLNASEIDGAAHFGSSARSWIEIQEMTQ